MLFKIGWLWIWILGCGGCLSWLPVTPSHTQAAWEVQQDTPDIFSKTQQKGNRVGEMTFGKEEDAAGTGAEMTMGGGFLCL